MKKNYQFPFSMGRKMLKDGMLIVALLAMSMGYSQNEDTIQLGDGDGNVNYFPMYYLYNYSYTQTVYSAEELYEQGAVEQATSITKIKYKPTSSQSTSNWKDWVVYIGNTSKESFDDNADWVPISDMSEVFDGQLQDDVTAGEWVEITLDTPFEWDGTSNIVIAVDQNTGNWGSNPDWAGYTSAPVNGSKGIYYYDDSTNPNPDDPPTEGGSLGVENKVAQIQLVGEFLISCDGTPTAGTVEEDDLNVCAGIDFSVSVFGASNPANGLERIWQSSPAGEDEWTDIDGATDPSYTVQEGVEEPTDFRYTVTCTNSDETDISNMVTVNLNPALECYCIPDGSDNSDDIANFSIGDLDNNSDSGTSATEPGYSDFTESVDPVELVPDESYEASLTSGSGSGNHGAAIWIDYNDDGLFSSSEKVATISSSITGGATATFSEFTVSNNPGIHRLRVQYTYLKDGADMDPCDISSPYSETEDYTVEIIELDECQGTPTAGTIDDEDFSICGGNAFSISVSEASDPAGGLERIWQSSPEGEGDWADIEGATSSTYNVNDGIDEPKDFRYKVTCTNSDETDISDVITVTLNPAEECYCIPEGTNSSRYIDDFTTSEGEENITNTGSGFSDNGYGDFTDMTVEQVQSSEVSFEVNIEGGSAGFRIWVDWNQDGQFDTSEEVAYQSVINDISHSGSFTVPADANPGETKMRIVSHWLSTTGDADPCETAYIYGEFEDYNFSVVAMEGCEGTPIAGTAADDFSVCAGNAFTLSVDGASDPAGGLDRIWQSSPEGEDDWTDIDGASSTTYSTQDGIEEPTDFRFKVICTASNETDISDVITVSLNPDNECYCTPTYSTGCSSNERISNVNLTGESESFDNDSECSDDAYGDYTDLTPPDLKPGSTYTLSVSTDSTFPASEQVRAWIDYNQDGQFSDDEEIANTNGDGLEDGMQTFDFTVSEYVDAGNYRMRVRQVYGPSAPTFDACSDESFGETEDYTVEIIQLDDCEGTPTAGTIGDDFSSVCAGSPFSLSVSGASDPANGLVRIWQSSPAGENNWTDIDGEASYTYSVPDGIIEATDFRYKATCTNSDETVFSDAITLSLKAADECYCIPVGGADNGNDIVNFTLGDLDNDSESGSSTSGYSDFSVSVDPVDLIPGESYEASLTAGPGSGNHGAAIWIDYNDDGLFDSSEKVATLGIVISGGDTVTFPEFTVPDSPGMHQLRVQYTKGQHGGDLDPCQVSTSNSETEDYMVNVVGDSCPTPSDVSVDVENTTVVVDWTENGSATEWELIYGAPGFNLETDGTTITVQEKPAAISDLDPQTDYEIYVIAICDDGNVSDPSDSEAFTTGELSVDNPLFENFTFYPNPVKGQLTLKAGMQIENVKVYNLLGQNVLSSKPNTVEAQLDTERLQSGIYLMKVTIDGSAEIFRLIKR